MIFRRISSVPAWDWGSPLDELERIRRQMDRLSDLWTGSPFMERAAGVFPLISATEDRDNYYVRAELPGIKAEELDISVTGNSLSLAGERKIPAEDEKVKYHRREREAGKFSRMITLPAQIDSAKVAARCADGILTILLPKAESAKPKQIAVKTS
jgi:HSP20 family protein